MDIGKYFELYDNNVSGIYTTEKWLINNAINIYEIISLNDGNSLSEKAYKFRFNINETPKCPNCGKRVKYKNKTIGYQKYCSNSCGSSGSKNLAKETLFKEYGVYHPSLIPKNIKKRKNKRIDDLIKLIGNSELINITEDEEYEIKCDLCEKNHRIERKVLDQRVYLGLDWRSCISYSFNVSNGEIDVRNFIKSIYNGTIIYNDRKLIGSEIDIFIPEFKIGQPP